MTAPRARIDANPQIDRRRFLQGSALAGFGAFLAACGGSGGLASAAPSGAASAAPSVATGPLKFANWPAYIDLSGKAAEDEKYSPGSSPTLEQFKEKYKVQVDYEEKIGDNAEFMATIQPALVAGLPTGWDLIVLTSWMAAKVISSKWVETITPGNVPNAKANLRDPLRGAAFDPDNAYHYPWQSGMTGIGYNAATLAENKLPEPTKLADLWNIPPDRVTFLTEARDTFGLTLLKLGIKADPKTVTNADLDKAAADIKPLVDKGLRFTGNEYIQDFVSKKVWAAYVWSGDLASSGGENDKFIFPEEGTMIWTDNMLIPKGAANKYTAELMVDFVYDPVVAAQIENYVYYVSPVKGADAEIAKLDPDAASNPLLFPPPDVVAKSYDFQDLSPELEDHMNELFADLTGV